MMKKVEFLVKIDDFFVFFDGQKHEILTFLPFWRFFREFPGFFTIFCDFSGFGRDFGRFFPDFSEFWIGFGRFSEKIRKKSQIFGKF